MTSTPQPTRTPLTEAEYQTLRQLEDDIAALKAARAPVAEIGRKVAELKRGGLWRRPFVDNYPTSGIYAPRVSKSWEDYCTYYLPFTRRYADQTIRLAGAGILYISGDNPPRPKSKERGMSRPISFRVSDQQYEKLKQAQEAFGYTDFSDFLRDVLVWGLEQKSVPITNERFVKNAERDSEYMRKVSLQRYK